MVWFLGLYCFRCPVGLADLVEVIIYPPLFNMFLMILNVSITNN